MKQLIVLIATVVLGLSIAGTVMGMGKTTTDLATKVSNSVETNMKIPADISANFATE